MTNEERLAAWNALTPRQRSFVTAQVVFGKKITYAKSIWPTYAEDGNGMMLVVERMRSLERWHLTDMAHKLRNIIRIESTPSHSLIYTRDVLENLSPDNMAFAACAVFGNAFDAALKEIGGER